MMKQLLALPACPVYQGTIQMPQYAIQTRLVEPAIVLNPPANDRVEHSGKILDGFVRFQMHTPVMDPLPALRVRCVDEASLTTP